MTATRLQPAAHFRASMPPKINNSGHNVNLCPDFAVFKRAVAAMLPAMIARLHDVA
jgi:hypothetical protein